jgi:hypothetical protein
VIFSSTLTNRVTKVPKARSAPFWHFCHLITLKVFEKYTTTYAT